MVLRENDQSKQVYPSAVSATKASTNSVEPIKDTTEAGLEIVGAQISKTTESAKAHLATLMSDAEEKTKKAVDLGTDAAKKAHVIAFDAEAAATEAEREHRNIVDSAVPNEEKLSQKIDKNEDIKNKIVSFALLAITVGDAYKEAKRAAISTEAAKEAWKHAEIKAWLFKNEALNIDGETVTVVAAAEGANIAAKEASKASSECRNAVAKVKAAIENVNKKSHKLSLSYLLQRAMEKFKSTVKEAEKEMEQFEAAANLAKDGAAEVAEAWLALSNISNAQTQAAKQELDKKERKTVAMEDIEGTTQAGQNDFQQQNNKTRRTTAYMLLCTLIIASIGAVACIGLPNFARMQALHVLLQLGYQMVGGQPIEEAAGPEGGQPIEEAAEPEVVIELANMREAEMFDIAFDQVDIALDAAQDAGQAQNLAMVARGNAAAARRNAEAILNEAREVRRMEIIDELREGMNNDPDPEQFEEILDIALEALNNI